MTESPRPSDRQARVLHVCTRYQRGGSERRIRDLIAATPELHHHLLLGGESDADLALAQTGAEQVTVAPALVRAMAPLSDLRFGWQLSRVLRAGNYDLLVTHQSKAGALGRAAAQAAAGPPVLHSLSMASFGPGYGRLESLLFRRLERLLARRTAVFCVVGSDLAARYAALGIPAERLHVVRSGVPLPSVTASRGEARRLATDHFGVPPEGPMLIYLGSQEPRKNVALLPALLGELHSLDVSAVLVIVGAGPDQSVVAENVRSLGLERHVVFTGHVTDPGLVAHLVRAADLLLLLSRAEGLPQVLVQAAALGTPFVAFDVEGVREIIDLGATGLAVPAGDLSAAAAAAAELLSTGRPRAGRSPDLTSWSAGAIVAGYRDAVGQVLPGAVRHPGSAPSGTRP